jgi:hypothetical protein
MKKVKEQDQKLKISRENTLKTVSGGVMQELPATGIQEGPEDTGFCSYVCPVCKHWIPWPGKRDKTKQLAKAEDGTVTCDGCRSRLKFVNAII